MQILIVEDEALLAMALGATLEDAGHRVIGPAATADRALGLAGTARPDLALVDIRLRGSRSGVDVARELRTRGIPSLFLSGQSDEARANRAVAFGFLGKPFLPATVIATVALMQRIIAGETPSGSDIPGGLEIFVH